MYPWKKSYRIIYKTRCGLTVTRLIFVLPQYKGLPLATEVRENRDKKQLRHFTKYKNCITGMFGLSRPMAQWEDVIYSTVIMQSRVLQNDDGSIIAISPTTIRNLLSLISVSTALLYIIMVRHPLLMNSA